MKYNPDIHHRRSIRLRGYDYSQSGLYFITICTQDRLCLFGEIKNGANFLNDAGKMIQSVWEAIPMYYKGVDVNGVVVMPNHIHGIIIIKHDSNIIDSPVVGAGPCACPCSPQGPGQAQGPAPTGGRMSLPDMVHRFKTFTTKKYADGVKLNNWQRFNKKLWQRNYYEHIIRSDKSYQQIFEYIQTNPLKWRDDKYYVSHNVR